MARRSRWTWPSPGALPVLVDLDVAEVRDAAGADPGEDEAVAETAGDTEDLAESSEVEAGVAVSSEAAAHPAEVTAEVAAVEREAREVAAAEARAMERPSSPPTRGRQSNQLQCPRSYTPPLCLAVSKTQTKYLEPLILKKWIHK